MPMNQQQWNDLDDIKKAFINSGPGAASNTYHKICDKRGLDIWECLVLDDRANLLITAWKKGNDAKAEELFKDEETAKETYQKYSRYGSECS